MLPGGQTYLACCDLELSGSYEYHIPDTCLSFCAKPNT